MAIIGKFIGVNKYNDPKIRDLVGTKNDATALWALFTDTLPSMKSELLTGEQATVENIKNALKNSLKQATDEDVVIIFYSGHGSQNLRITGYDTSLTDLDKTTIAMQDIAELFKQSTAKNILCILDCCFSGGAPAKVLEDSPIARSTGNPLDELAGEGRIIIAASNFDEPSYELPSTGHGILTKAIIDVLRSNEESVNLLIAMNDVMEIVRAEAVRIGVIQTPVLVNHITGGLVLPSLRAGKNYYEAFPQHKGAKISKDMLELTKFGISSELCSEWASIYPNGLNELQFEAINDYRILDGDPLLVIAPTSSGKTFVGELAGAKVISEGRKSVFLFPYKALVNEKFDQFVDLYSKKFGYQVIRCTGDYSDQNNEFIKGKYDIALFTYEMFLNLSVSIPEVLHNIGLVVLDEGQFITDQTRGISEELLLTNLVAARNRGVEPQLIVLSAVIGESNYFEDWLGCKRFITSKRPVPLTEGVMDRSGRYIYRSETGEIADEQLIPSYAIVQRRDRPSQQDMIVPLVKSLVDEGEKVIVFRNQRGNAEGCAEYLANGLGLEPATAEADKLPRHNSSNTSPKLRRCFMGGTAFHTSNLSRDERKIVERVYRDADSKIRVLSATTTVAAGINTPASTVVLAEQEFRGEDGRPFSIAEYKNMAGRAGRVGFNERGKSIILAELGSDPRMLFNKYVLGEPEDLKSSFDIQHIETWLIRLLAQVKGIHRDDIVNLLSNTYGGYVANRKDPDWEKNMRLTIANLYAEMIRLEILEEENGIVHLTILGKTCGESVISFRSAMRFVDLLRQYSKTTLEAADLMALVQALPESDDSYTPMFRRGTSESQRAREASERFGWEMTRLLQKYTNGDEFVYYARCKRASILFDWVTGVPTSVIEENFKSRNPFLGNISYGDLRRFADFTRFQLRSAYKIALLLFPGRIINDEEMDDIMKSLEVGIPVGSLDLLSLPFQMSREEYLAIIRNGIKSAEDFFLFPTESLTQFLEPATLQEYILVTQIEK
jgi:helicase